MRTEDQIKKKLHQLSELLKVQEDAVLQAQAEMLEWVLNQPVGGYHVK